MKPLPDHMVITIHQARGKQKDIARAFGVSESTVANIKAGDRHAELIARHEADQVRSRFAILATLACAPQATQR